ncbi:putative nucleotidyltransferase [Deinococcus metalli]|nr:hypothetical protein [Deinococcus metalli]MBB5378111.1 putative nucleotidyltransferase [Deinococcus metalli]
MTRVALACLLLLVACKAKDPAGTLPPGDNGAVVIRELRAGPSLPFRLTAGAMTFQAVAFGGIANAHQQACQAQFTLTPYVKEDEQPQAAPVPLVPNTSVEVATPGLYVIQLRTTQNYCWYAVTLDPKE